MQLHSRKAQQCPNIVYSLSPTVTAIHHQLQPESERLLGEGAFFLVIHGTSDGTFQQSLLFVFGGAREHCFGPRFTNSPHRKVSLAKVLVGGQRPATGGSGRLWNIPKVCVLGWLICSSGRRKSARFVELIFRSSPVATASNKWNERSWLWKKSHSAANSSFRFKLNYKPLSAGFVPKAQH